MMDVHDTRQPFEAYGIALKIIRELKPLIPRLKKCDSNLAKHAREAGSSIPLNLKEGNRRLGRDRIHHFSIAAGSADEVQGVLDVSECWGYLQPSELTRVRELLDRELAILWRLTHPG